jgi:hypothetical protein
MGGGPSAQCKLGTFGTGDGVLVNYKGIPIKLGGSNICQTTLAECANECEALGCGGTWGDCCKLCERSCCQPGAAYNPNSLLCQQISYNARVKIPDDYCANSTSRQKYDEECPEGCVEQSLDVSLSKSKTVNKTPNFPLSLKLILILVAVALSFLFFRNKKIFNSPGFQMTNLLINFFPDIL